MFDGLFTKKASILMIDDERTSRMIVRCCLEKNLKIDFREADCGETGLRMARAHSPDLILLDWKMPDLSGIKVLEALQGQEQTRSIPVLMLSAKTMMAEIDEALIAGATDYLTKPLDIPQIIKKVKANLPAHT